MVSIIPNNQCVWSITDPDGFDNGIRFDNFHLCQISTIKWKYQTTFNSISIAGALCMKSKYL